MSCLRRLVSLKKRRYEEHGFDLDLQYITPRIIATGIPALGAQAIIRNPYKQLYRLLERFHEGRYKLWNLCSEKNRQYDASLFHGRVSTCLRFPDHNPPPLAAMGPFCAEVKEWLDADPDNVAVIHCKAGKGRTGVMICAYLVFSGLFPDPDEAMAFYAVARTKNMKGLTIPSQRRYVSYFSRVLAGMPPTTTISLLKAAMSPIPYSSCDIHLRIFNNGETHSTPSRHFTKHDSSGELHFDPIRLSGDVRVVGFNGSKKIFHFWFHTSMVPGTHLLLGKADIDKYVSNKDIMPQFELDLVFDATQEAPVEPSSGEKGDEAPESA